MVQRLTFRRRHSFNTRSNGVKIIKTPGGTLAFQHRAKLPNGPRCGDCGSNILGVPHLRPKEYSRIPKSARTVTRAYGGSRCAECVRNRIVRAFLIEEQKIVKSVLKTKEKEKRAIEKSEKKKAAKTVKK